MTTALVKTDVAAAWLGWSAAKLFDLVDGPSGPLKGFYFVFNLAAKPHGQRRALRFWLPEVQSRTTGGDEALRRLPIDTVIARILPVTRSDFQAGEVDQLFQIRPRTRIDLHRELAGNLEGGRHFYARKALVDFLRRRWLGTLGRETRAQRRPT